METIYIAEFEDYRDRYIREFKGKRVLAIGVRNTHYSVERLEQDTCLTIEQRFPEIHNPRYVYSESRDNHILQPVIVKFK